MMKRNFRKETGRSSHKTLLDNIGNTTKICRVLANGTRLKILCYLVEEEKSVSQIQKFTKQQQPTVSQQLARLRTERLVSSRRDGKVIYYTLRCRKTRAVLRSLNNIFEYGVAAKNLGSD